MFKLMVRFWPTAGLLLLLAGFLGLAGYGGCMAMRGVVVDPQGTWLGPWPLDGADDCRTQLLPNGRFDLECRAKERYAAAGRWSREGNTIRFDFDLFIRNREKVSDAKEMVLRTDGSKNTMFVGPVAERGEPYRWQRQRL